MSTYILMRILEYFPRRYEFGIRLITLGRLERVCDRLAKHVRAGQHVLDLGCGTGALTIRMARQGAKVKAIDVNAQMLDFALERAQSENLAEYVDFAEMGVAELDGEKSKSYDAVTSVLCFSELNGDEFAFTLKQIVRILRPGGLLLVADEVKSLSIVTRIGQLLVRTPLVVVTYLITQHTTHPIKNLSSSLTEVGLSIVSVRTSLMGSFSEFVAQKPNGVTR